MAPPPSEADKEHLYTLDDFVAMMHPLQRPTNTIYYNFQRIGDTFVIPKSKVLFTGMCMLSSDLCLNMVQIVRCARSGNLELAKQSFIVFTIDFYLLLRAITVYTTNKEVARIFTSLDSIFPRTRSLQQRMKLPQLATYLRRRFFYFHRAVSVGLGFFVGVPLFRFATNFDTSKPIPIEFHQHTSWYPFGLKESYIAFPFTTAYQTAQSTIAVLVIVAFDRIFTMIIGQMALHFEFLCTNILEMDARDSKDRRKCHQLYEHMKKCMAYHQFLNKLGADLSKMSSLAILICDLVSAASICFHFYLMTGTDDFISIVLNITPCFILIWITYDISQQGSQLETMSGSVLYALYDHNWYDGSIEYRKYIRTWMHHASEPYKLTAYGMFTVNVVHFQSTMMLAYQMLTCLNAVERG